MSRSIPGGRVLSVAWLRGSAGLRRAPAPLKPRRRFSGNSDGMIGNAPYGMILASQPNQSSFLFGMRGAAETTSSRAGLPTATRIDLRDEGR